MCQVFYGHDVYLIKQVTTDLEKLSVRHEALQMQSELVVSAYEQKLGSLDCSLKESKLACEEGACTIDNLESSKAELVCYNKCYII